MDYCICFAECRCACTCVDAQSQESMGIPCYYCGLGGNPDNLNNEEE